MSPQPSIAHYRITAKLGEGGMGGVWRATDTKLNREVAIKILPDSFAADPDRLARFTREAQVLACLNHPNVAQIYGVEERALVMELVEGADLSGPVSEEQSLPIVHQLIDALEYAHDKGIIHRDLKSANIKVTPDGHVKVLDFGLAKAIATDAAQADPKASPTLTMRETALGMIVGTAAYMAPEQARGQNVDKRADIWAFGVVLYELLTGKQLFLGPTISDTLAAVLRQEIDLASIPARFRRLLRVCLERDPRRRMRDIGDARILLEGAPEAAHATARTKAPWAVAGALALIALACGWIAWRAAMPASLPMMRFSVDLGPDAVAGVRTTVAISPDGTRIVYPVRTAGGNPLATRLLDQSKTTILAGTDNARDAFFSPDGQWIGFFANEKLKKVSVQGGAPLTLCEYPATNGDRGGSWAEGGFIVATLDARRLYRIPEAGGEPQMLSMRADPNEAANYRWPQVLPGGEMVLFTAGMPGTFDDAAIRVVSLKTGEVKDVFRGGYFGRYLSSGHLIYVHHGTLFAVPFDLRRMEVRGQSAPVQEEIAGNSTNGGGELDFSPGPASHGTFVYLVGSNAETNRSVAWMDSAGKMTPLLPPAGAMFTPRFSPDGKNLAIAIGLDIYTYAARRGAMTRITFDRESNLSPVWTPDGRHIVYGPNAGGIWWTPADGSSQPKRILEAIGRSEPNSFSPDGRLLAYYRLTDTAPQIWILPLDTTNPDHPKAGKPELFPASSAGSYDPAFSPDGRWLAYSSTESNSYQVYVRPYPATTASGKWQVSTAPSRYPIWSRNGRELFFESFDGHIMVAGYTTKDGAFIPEKPRRWSETPILMTSGYRDLDLAPDGKRVAVFLEPAPAGAKASLHATFLTNFFDELKRKMPAK